MQSTTCPSRSRKARMRAHSSSCPEKDRQAVGFCDGFYEGGFTGPVFSHNNGELTKGEPCERCPSDRKVIGPGMGADAGVRPLKPAGAGGYKPPAPAFYIQNPFSLQFPGS